MKKLLSIILLFISVSSISQSKTISQLINENPDKVNHFSVGYLIRFSSNAIIDEITKNKHIAFVGGIALSVLAGHLKECYDKKNTNNYSRNDFIATSIGGAFGSVTVRLIIGKSTHRKIAAKKGFIYNQRY